MLRKPNDRRRASPREPNHIWKRFSKEFKILLDPGYYEGTKFAQFFNVVDKTGRSNIYVTDPHENDLKEFDTSPFNEMKFLIGYAGMGKTTLLRNYYRITDRDVEIRGNEYIFYISFYYANLSITYPEESLVDEVNGYLSSLIEKLNKEHPDITRDRAFWDAFYDYILEIKPTLVSNIKFIPSEFMDGGLEINDRKTLISKKLTILQNEKKLEYNSMLIKFLLKVIGAPYKITLIFDDIESKDSIYHPILIEVARHLYSCFNASTDEHRTIKVLVSLRAYTFRQNIDRTAEARRELIEKSVILKKHTASLMDIFDLRFNAISAKRMRDKDIGNEDSYKQAKRVLDIVMWRADSVGRELFLEFENYNLCHAMELFAKVLTNSEWIATNEQDNNGSFQLDGHNYRITANNIVKAIGMSNLKYYDGTSVQIPNIIQHDGRDTELICLYIIRYCINLNITDLYGTDFIIGEDLTNDLLSLFCNYQTPDAITHQWKALIKDSVAFLYNKGVLFRSLYDVEVKQKSGIERKYDPKYRLYLAPRGLLLYDLLSSNSILLEIYRDDIEIDLKNNDTISSELGSFERFNYIISTIRYLFEKEKSYIAQALWGLDKYTDWIGDTLICEHLLRGVIMNINAYYGEKDEEHDVVVNLVKELINEMTEYCNLINSKYDYHFNINRLTILPEWLH